MTARFLRFALPLAAALLAAAPAAAQGASTLDEDLRLNAEITVRGDVVTLGDVFDGFLSRPEKVVAQAPRPGERMELSAAWLAELARTQGLDWRPAGAFERAVVYQPGVTVSTADILDAVKASLIAGGMPANFGIIAATRLAPVMLAEGEPRHISVRDAVFSAGSRTFSAFVQVSSAGRNTGLIPVRGAAFPTVSLPVLKTAMGRNTKISADMIDIVDVPEDQVQGAVITDARQLIGKTPKVFLRAGQPVRDGDVTQVTLVEIPVLGTGMDRDGQIARHDIRLVSYNAAHLPPDAVMDPAFLVGKSPRRALVGGEPIRRADVALVRRIDVPVAARDLPRGTTLTRDDFTWVMMNEGEVAGEIARDDDEIVGQMTRYGLRAGQPMRKHAFAKAVAVDRGQLVTIQWSAPGMNLTAQGHAKDKGGVGDVIRVTNTKSSAIVMAEIIDSRTVQIVAPGAANRTGR